MGTGVPVTLSAVVEKDGQPVLAPFPDWEQAKQTNVGTFDIDRKVLLFYYPTLTLKLI